MMDFISKLYNNDNFVLYLTIILVILIILFVIVLIFGKKDQKLEETKRLQKIEIEHAFKETKEEPVKLETAKIEEEKPMEQIEEKPKEDLPSPKPEEKETSEIVQETDKVNVTIFEPVLKETEDSLVLNSKEEEKALEPKEVSLDEFDEISASIAEGINNLENITKEFKDIEIPTQDLDEKPKEFKPTPVFSSVYVPLEKEEVKVTVDEAKDIPKPTLVAQDSDEEDEFALPDLAETKEEKPLEPKDDNLIANMTSFDFDDLPNETYNLK